MERYSCTLYFVPQNCKQALQPSTVTFFSFSSNNYTKICPIYLLFDVCLLDLTCLLPTMYIVHVQVHRYLNYFITYPLLGRTIRK